MLERLTKKKAREKNPEFKKIKYKQTKQIKQICKMADLNPTTLVITVNVSGQNTIIRRQNY